jgi:hypothetical protein
MSEYASFIPPASYAALPSDRDAIFGYLSDIAYSSYAFASLGENGSVLNLLQTRFIMEVSAIAKELGFDDLAKHIVTEPTENEWNAFLGAISALKARNALRIRFNNSVESISVGQITKHRLFQEFERLKRLVAEANIEDWRKKSLNDMIDELSDELHRNRITFRKVVTLAAAIAGLSGGTVTTLANAQEAKETVLSVIEWIGEEVGAQEQSLPKEPRALPAPEETLALAHSTKLEDGEEVF